MRAWLDGGAGWADEVGAKGELFEVCAPAAERALLDAPWEVLADEDGFLAARGWSPVRRFEKGQKAAPASKYALSVLFMAAAPRGVDGLSFEAEETAILAATERARLDLIVEDSGTPEELGVRLAELEEMDVLHISCHGSAGTNEPKLALEDDFGDLRQTTTADLVRELGEAGKKLRLVFLSACLTAKRDLVDSMATRLIKSGYQAALAWAGSVRDADATLFAAELYARLAKGNSLAYAVGAARQVCLSPSDGREPAKHWHLARLYLGPNGGGNVARAKGKRKHTTQDVAKAFLDARRGQVAVAGRAQFVGRRRPLQRVLRAYRREGQGGSRGVLLTGLGRQGKSSLALRLSTRTPELRLAVVHGVLSAARIFQAAR